MRDFCTRCVFACSLFAGCAFVEFEPAPYAPRELTVVYSAQEDVTFIAWQLDEHADADAVTFELAGEDGVLRPIDLASAPFPAAPYPCGRAICFQYQVPGHFVPPASSPLLRVTHPRFGEFASPRGTLVEVSETFAVDPIAVDRNERADARRYDYFAEEGIPFVRDYRWRLIDGGCETDAALPELAPLTRLVDLPEGWTTPACFEASTVRTDAPGTITRAPLVKSAETWLVPRQRYDAPAIRHTTLYALLFDLAVADPTRCTEVREVLSSRISAALSARDPGAVRVGVYEPDDARECAANRAERYPVSRMLADVQDAALAVQGLKTILWVVISNRVELNPAFDLAWEEVRQGSAAIEPSPAYEWWISSVLVVGRDGTGERPENVQWVTPYRPIEEETLLEDIDTVATLAVPFRTLDHDLDTRVALELGAIARPEYGRICQAVPALASLEVAGEPVDDTFAWPARDAPLYTVDLGLQVGVPNELFVARRSEVLFEVCARFCDGPFRTADGADHESWLASGVCAGHP